jgi:hypothetical protein
MKIQLTIEAEPLREDVTLEDIREALNLVLMDANLSLDGEIYFQITDE